ncbi:uncharacterized protein LOC111137731 isoform X2 [Crassostrea virginica]
MKALYRYPQNQFPYEELLEKNLERTAEEAEFELTDTGIFDDDEYFDVLVEYGKDPNNERNLVCCYSITNRSSQSADLTVIPMFHLPNNPEGSFKIITKGLSYSEYEDISKCPRPVTVHHKEKKFFIEFECDEDVKQNEIFVDSNVNLLKDIVCKGKKYNAKNKYEKANPKEYRYACPMRVNIKPNDTKQMYWTIFEESNKPTLPLKDILNVSREKAEEFYRKMLPSHFSQEQKFVARQAFAGLLWSKQTYKYNVKYWRIQFESNIKLKYESIRMSHFTLLEIKAIMESCMMDNSLKFEDKFRFNQRRQEWMDKLKENKYFMDPLLRNSGWTNVNCCDVIAVPDKWEFPWFATWDTAFQMLPFTRLDPGFTKHQLLLFLGERYMRADGQMPGCEWDMDLPFPPVYAWSCYRVFCQTGHTDLEFLQNCFNRLQLNFKWWLKTMQHRDGSFLFTGGFLGMDNISVVDRSFHLKQNQPLIQADATGWMAFFALSMLEIALVFSSEPKADHKCHRACVEYLDKFLSISEAMNKNIDNGGLWHPHDRFYYDVIPSESGDRTPIVLRSLVGIIPLLACLNINRSQVQSKSGKLMMKHLDELIKKNSPFVRRSSDGDYILSAVPLPRFLHILRHLSDEEEFLSPFGIRSLSKVYEMDPYILKVNKDLSKYLDLDLNSTLKVKFAPAESDTDVMGGNSNWRGPIWLCMNFLIVEVLLKMDEFYEDGIKMIHPSLSNRDLRLGEIAGDICKRVFSLFAVNQKTNARPCHGEYEKYKQEKSWQNNVLFYEYFDSETGRGCGASHQTGWTALVVEFLYLMKQEDSKTMTEKWKHYCSPFDNASDFTTD